MGWEVFFENEFEELRSDFELLDFFVGGHGDTFFASKAGLPQFFKEETEHGPVLESDFPDQIQPVDVDGLKGPDSCERLAELGDFLAQR